MRFSSDKLTLPRCAGMLLVHQSHAAVDTDDLGEDREGLRIHLRLLHLRHPSHRKRHLWLMHRQPRMVKLRLRLFHPTPLHVEVPVPTLQELLQIVHGKEHLGVMLEHELLFGILEEGEVAVCEGDRLGHCTERRHFVTSLPSPSGPENSPGVLQQEIHTATGHGSHHADGNELANPKEM